jgi:hypothetical protein
MQGRDISMVAGTGGIPGGARLCGSVAFRVESFTVVTVQYGLIRMRDIPDG